MASRFRLRIRAWAILVPVTALTAGCSGTPQAAAPVEISTAATIVTITASDGAPGPLSIRVLTAHAAVADLAEMANHLQPMPQRPTAVSYCGMAVGLPLTISVIFTGRHQTPATLVVTPLLSSGLCNSTRLTVGARTGPILQAGDLTATVVSQLPVPLSTLFKEAATYADWPPALISHFSLAGRAGAWAPSPSLSPVSPRL